MNKVMDAALDLVGGTEIGKQVKDLQGTVMDTIDLKAETKEALQEANLDQVATTYETLASKVGIIDQKEIITKFIINGRDNDKFTELHNKIKSLAQQGGADISKLDGVLTTHELTGGFDGVGTYGVAKFFGKVFSPFKKVLEKLNIIHSPKDLGKMVFAISEVTTKVDVSKLENKGENGANGESKSPESLKDWDGTVEGLKGKLVRPLKGDDLYITTEQGEFGDDRGDHKHEGIDLGGESDEVVAPYNMKITEIAYQEGKAGNYVKANIEPETSPIVTFKFFHLKEQPDLEIGTIISQGEIFAIEGSTGRSSGEHLHFEIEGDGKARDPLKAYNPEEIKYIQGGNKVAFTNREHADDYRQAA